MIRKELKKDKFSEFLGRVFLSLNRNWKSVLGIILVIILFSGAFAFFGFRNREKELSAMKLLDRGQIAFREERFSDAKILFEKVRKDFPDTRAGEAALFYVGESVYHIGNLDEMGRIFNEYLLQYPEGEFCPRVQEGLGYILEKKGELDRAIGAYRKVYENYPESYLCPQAFLGIARCYEAMEKWEEAKKAYEELISSYPWSSSTALAREYLEVAKWEISRRLNTR